MDPVTGRSHGVGKRKTSVALVWLKEGQGELPAAARQAGWLAGWLAGWQGLGAGWLTELVH